MKIYFLINPRSGDTKSVAENWIDSAMIETGVEKDSYTVEITKGDTIIEQVINAFQQADTVIAMGGDGTIHAMVNGYIKSGETNKKIGLIPAGTGNDFFRHFSPYRKFRRNRKSYLSKLLAGRTETHSIWKIGDTCFSNYFSIGFDAKVISDFDKRRKRRKKHSGRIRNYITYALLGIANMTFSIDGEIILSTDNGEIRSGKGIIISNVRRYAGGSVLPWESEDTLCAVSFENSWHYFKLMFSRVIGKPVNVKGIHFFKQGKLVHSPTYNIQIDGERYDIAEMGQDLEIRQAGTIDVLVPDL